MGLKQGYCFLWNETVAKKVSDEIASNVFRYIEKMSDSGVIDFIFYSDNCTGQNRNSIVFSMYLLAAKKFNVNITHRFLEVGHTQNSGDSMHSAIERVSKNQNVYTQKRWADLMQQAAIKKPYIVPEVTQEEIYDFLNIFLGKE